MAFGFNKKSKKSDQDGKKGAPEVPVQDASEKAPQWKDFQTLGAQATSEQLLSAFNNNLGDKQALTQMCNGAILAFREGRTENAHTLVNTMAINRGHLSTTKEFDEGHRLGCAQLLRVLLKEKNFQTPQDLHAFIGKQNDTQKQTTLNALLRVICSDDNQPELIDFVIRAGADVHSYDDRALVNALHFNKPENAHALVFKHGADIDAAENTSKTYMINHDTHAQKLTQLRLEKIVSEADGDKIMAMAAAEHISDTAKKILLDTLQKQDPHNDGDLFDYYVAGITQAKRGIELGRKIDNNYFILVITPLTQSLLKSADPEARLSRLLNLMPARDHSLLLDLTLRHVSGEIGSVPLARMLIKAGADPCTMGNRPLRLAVTKGHTDLVTALITEYGASIQGAIYDAQLNGTNAETMQKLYATMVAFHPAPVTKPTPISKKNAF